MEHVALQELATGNSRTAVTMGRLIAMEGLDTLAVLYRTPV
jgi:hypothetical protein